MNIPPGREHDVIGHGLTSIALKSELAARLLARADSPMSLEQARHQIDEVQQLARAELEHLRSWLQEQGFAVSVEAQLHRALRLCIADNGAAATVVEGNGLRGIRERARALGGKMHYSADGGMRLEIELPLEDTIEAA